MVRLNPTHRTPRRPRHPAAPSGHRLAERRVMRSPDLAHAAFPNQGDDFIGADAGAGANAGILRQAGRRLPLAASRIYRPFLTGSYLTKIVPCGIESPV